MREDVAETLDDGNLTYNFTDEFGDGVAYLRTIKDKKHKKKKKNGIFAVLFNTLTTVQVMTAVSRRSAVTTVTGTAVTTTA